MQQNGHIPDILDQKCNEATMKVLGFYNSYRMIFVNSLRLKEFVVQLKNNKKLENNETIMPC